jgi:hypothetical protein
MAKFNGKDAQLWFGAREYEFTSGTLDLAYEMVDTTDSSTPGDGMDSIVGWGEASLKIEGFLTSALGAEVTTGTAVAGTRYLVTGGSIVETQGTFILGRIFESDGTGSLSSTNKVKPIGVKEHGKAMACTLGGSDFPCTSIKFSEKYNESDATDSATTGDQKEFVAGRCKRTSTIEAFVDAAVADALLGAPAAQALVLTFASGDAITGSAILTKKSIPIQVEEGVVKVSYEAEWQGVPTNTCENLLTRATSTAGKLVLKPGSSTDKGYSGNMVVLGMDIAQDMNSPAKVSYDIKFSGAVTSAVAN